MTILRAQARRHGVVLAAGPLGKIKMGVQVFTLLALMAYDITGVLLQVVLAVMAVITILSGIEVAMRARRDRAPVAAPAT